MIIKIPYNNNIPLYTGAPPSSTRAKGTSYAVQRAMEAVRKEWMGAQGVDASLGDSMDPDCAEEDGEEDDGGGGAG